MSAMNRRTVLAASGAIAAGAAVNLLPGVAFGAEKPRTGTETKTVKGTFPTGTSDFFYLPITVPRGVSKIDVKYSYDKPTVPQGTRGNACDIGMFGPEGYQPGNKRGFRGWSGGFRDSFSISASEATPGYIAGPIKPGTWHVILGPYTVAPQGLSYDVNITLTYGPAGPTYKPNPAPTSAPKKERGRAWYRGDSHLHTVHSDGRRTPAELVADARAAGLDFVTSTDHNTYSSQLQWGDHATDDLLILNGEEVTTRSGHWPAIGLPAGTWLDWRYRSSNPKAFEHFVAEAHRAGGLVVAAHPYANCFGCAYEFTYDHVDLVEVWNGPWDISDEASVTAWHGMLRQGQFVAAVGHSDAHNPDNTIGLPQTIVHADKLERGALMKGLAAGRSWIAESSAVDLTFRASARGRTAEIGDHLKVDTGTPITVTCEVSGVPGTTIQAIDQTGPTFSAPVDATGKATLTWTTYARYSNWVRAEVRRGTGLPAPMVALTNPIWFDARRG
ncbi:CehA/McbA family metallohydrolase [Luteipulveratus mongoliensis]|uniref:Phosphoesterase n=1 Tax=Luteipulveratus mongoliensis TaxID=571913 RepID=A0A0K1JED7_9MICO|nr:CehA/McbA family metallohydrolase [Luteipulveratus mongoliensis]AKU14958.1 phosphoesterase [Luteipulveratus mongoliensis]